MAGFFSDPMYEARTYALVCWKSTAKSPRLFADGLIVFSKFAVFIGTFMFKFLFELLVWENLFFW